jgi:nicotinamide mononucleotide (NMN) deamidase PncC/glycerol-3-phosphate cytidylyltransferase-like family protein
LKPEHIERIFNSGFRAMLVIAGGGSGALHALLSTPGASRFVSEAYVPYSPEALEHFLGKPPEQAVSPAAARRLAEKAFCQCLKDSGGKFPDSGKAGISCTAALQTARERRGDDRAFFGIKTGEAEQLYAICFSKTSRAEQEMLLSDWLLVLIARAVGAERGLMLPGSFNPVHQGHLTLLKVAEKMTGLRGIFELSRANVDKPMLTEDDCLRRVAAIRDVPVALTVAPNFVQKAQLFPQTTFVLGYDTAVRLVDPAYSIDWNRQWEIFQTLETRFLVAGRRYRGGFQTLENINLPKGCESLFEAIPEEKFREDISSTAIRTGELDE